MSETIQKYLGNPTLETERLILRKLEPGDAGDVFEYASDPEVSKYTTWETHRTLEDSRGFIQWTLGRYECDEAGEWGIVLKETGRLIGSMGFVRLDLQNSCGSFGYVLARKHWRKGLMPEAVKRLIRFGFEEMGLNRIEAYHYIENGASGRVMQKAGMTYEGLLRQKMFAKCRFWDVKQYAILAEEWNK